MFFATSNTHSCTEAIHGTVFTYITKIFMPPAGFLYDLVNNSKKEGLATHAAKHPVLEELTTVGYHQYGLLDDTYVENIIVSCHVARAAVVSARKETRINGREDCIYSVWALRKQSSVRAGHGVYR